MQTLEKEIRELRRLLRDLVALATTPAGWVGRDREQIAESVADIVLHTLRAEAVYVCLRSAAKIEVIRSPHHPGFGDEVRRLWPESDTGLQVDTIAVSKWPTTLRVAIQPMGISGDDGFIAIGSTVPEFPNESESLLLSVASNQTAVALQTARLREEAELVERKRRAAAESERSRLHELFMQAPAAIGFLTGPEHRFTFVNLDYLKLTGRQRAEDFVGKTVREALPELEGQGLLELLDGVYQTGVPCIGTARKVILNRGAGGQPEDAYFDFIYQPMRDAAERIEGILIHANDVTQQVMTRQETENRERQFRTASTKMRGKQPYWMSRIMQHHIKPVAAKIEIDIKGWHTLRHSYTTLLRQNNNNPKVVQGLLRHASYAITMNVYDEAMSEEKRNAHRGVIQQLNRSVTRSAPKPTIPQVVDKVGVPDGI